MTTRRLGVAVAVLGGYLYAIGGSDGQCPLNTVERYDSRYNICFVIILFCQRGTRYRIQEPSSKKHEYSRFQKAVVVQLYYAS